MMECTLAELAQRVHSGRLNPKEWTWCVDTNPIRENGKFVLRICIFVMGTGAGQCEAMVILREVTSIADAKMLVQETFGIERVLVGVG